MATNQKPKSASQVKRNPDRRNGKATKKHPQTNPGSKGGYFGYSHKRLTAMAKEKGVGIALVIQDLDEKAREKRERQRNRTYSSPFGTGAQRPGIGEVTYKMTSVDRHFIKQQPYPCVPKGSAHAGKGDKKTDTTEAKQKREARRNGKVSIEKLASAFKAGLSATAAA